MVEIFAFPPNPPKDKVLFDIDVNDWQEDSTYASYGYSYRADVQLEDFSDEAVAILVLYDKAQAESGSYASFGVFEDGVLSIYSDSNEAIVIKVVKEVY